MPTGLEDNEFLLRCSCGSRMDHFATLVHEPDDSRGNNLKGIDDDWYLNITLDIYHSFLKRVLVGIKYIFFPRRFPYGTYSELVLKNDDVDKLAIWIQKRRMDRLNPIIRLHGHHNEK